MNKRLIEVLKKDDVINYLEGVVYKFTLSSVIKKACKTYTDKENTEYYSKYDVQTMCVPRLSDDMDDRLTTYYILN